MMTHSGDGVLTLSSPGDAFVIFIGGIVAAVAAVATFGLILHKDDNSEDDGFSAKGGGGH